MQQGYEIKVLDHGYVRFYDKLGSDEDIIEAARISTGRGFVSWSPYKRCKECDLIELEGMEAISSIKEQQECSHVWQQFPRGDLGILEYLYSEGHTSPFEMCELVIDVMVPMDHWRQWIRNRTASVNEYSTRYSPAVDEMAKTQPSQWRTQGLTNRQGSGEFLDEEVGKVLSAQEIELHDLARKVYQDRLAAGVAKEQARKDLPLSNYTKARWKIDLHNLLHNFLGKRLHPHAQLEIRYYAEAVAEIAKILWPRSYALFEEHTLYGAHFSRSELRLLRRLATGDLKLLDALAKDMSVPQATIHKLFKKLDGAI